MEEVVEQQQQLDCGGGGGGSSNPRRVRRVQPRRYADVHAVFGTSNVTRRLQGLPVQERRRAANTMATEVGWPMQDLVYGCTGVIDRLQQKIRAVQHELATT
ncbi:LOB domain-containing protein 4-like [Panicum virgatum]|uniref:LOB domain-containing protein 4-like n=1 Tax=Panicum virgatum TaxID=38727 RepID=UPI0019D5C5F5|nr:LOB domain-containing protein 4-like [Panicum virgatum]